MSPHKIPGIPSLFHQNRYITKYKDKTDSFNNFFANQCSLIKNSSVLPSVLFKRTENVISFIDFVADDIAKIIQNLDPNKAHGHDMIIIRMLKICGNSIYKPLQLIFRSCIDNGNSHLNGKKLMLFPFIRRVINKLWKITVLCLCFQFVVRFSNV